MPKANTPASSSEPADNSSAKLDQGGENAPNSSGRIANMPPPQCGSQQPDADTSPQEDEQPDCQDNEQENGKDGSSASDPTPEDEKEAMGILDHLSELRQRLVKASIAAAAGFGICWIFVDPLFNLLMRPLLAILPPGTHAQYTTLPEAFFIRVTVAFVSGLFVASPIIFYQIWAFVAPGLYEEEKRHIAPIAFLSAVFFIAGGVFCYFIVFPYAFNFFISYSTPEIVITPKASDYLSFCLKLIFAFGLIFEMPIFTFFLAKLGVITAAMMRKGRKYAIVGIFVLAAILTPPDVVSQILMACPMLLLYEISIGVAAIFGKTKKQDMANAPNDTN